MATYPGIFSLVLSARVNLYTFQDLPLCVTPFNSIRNGVDKNIWEQASIYY
jgi:hypothetical protein